MCRAHALAADMCHVHALAAGSIGDPIHSLHQELVFICNRANTNRPKIIKILDLLTTLTLFAHQSKCFTEMWLLLHANINLEPQMRVGRQVGTTQMNCTQKSITVPLSTLLSLLNTPNIYFFTLDVVVNWWLSNISITTIIINDILLFIT